MNLKSTVLAGVMTMTLSFSPALAQKGPSEEDLKKANNPLADVIALNVQNYYVPNLYGVPDETANTFWIRFAAPVSRFLIRASLPLPTLPTGDNRRDSGIGDLNLFAAYNIHQTSSTVFGLGPLVAMPTASKDSLGSGKWQLGAAAVYFNAKSAKVQYGGLLTYQTSIAGDDDRDDTNLLVAQPFAFWQLGGGTYLRTAPILVFNTQNGNYNVPFGFGIGKVMRSGNTVYNIFIEPQFTILHDGIGQPAFQLYTALNMQFR